MFIHKSRQLIISLSVAVLVLLAGTTAAAQRVTAPADDLADVAKTYQIEIVTVAPVFPVPTDYGAIDGQRAEPKQLENYTPLFRAEFTLYPTSFVKRSQLKRVVLCTELYFAGQRRNAVPDFAHDTLYLDVARGAYDRTYLRKVMHHEFFHIIDYRDDGELYSDERWSALNAPGFKYGTGGRNAQGQPTTSLPTDQFPGFLNHYSTTGVEEDKAELFAFLMVDYWFVQERIKRDGVLGQKVKMLKDLLKSFCPDMNDELWNKISKRQQSLAPRAGGGYIAGFFPLPLTPAGKPHYQSAERTMA